MEELPSNMKIDEIERKYILDMVEKFERFSDISPTLEMLTVIKNSLIDIKNILEIQNKQLEKLDSIHAFGGKLNIMENYSDNMTTIVPRLESLINNFRAKTISIENATKIMEDKAASYKEILETINNASADIEQRNKSILSVIDAISKLAGTIEEKSSGLNEVIEGYAASHENIEKSASVLETIQENIRDLRNDVFERNQYLNIILSDFSIFKATMEKNIQLLESSSIRLKELVEDVDKKTDDILNVTMKKIEDLQKLRDLLYDDIYQVDNRVKKVQKVVEKQKREFTKNSKKQTELMKIIKRMDKKIAKVDNQTRKKK